VAATYTSRSQLLDLGQLRMFLQGRLVLQRAVGQMQLLEARIGVSAALMIALLILRHFSLGSPKLVQNLLSHVQVAGLHRFLGLVVHEHGCTSVLVDGIGQLHVGEV